MRPRSKFTKIENQVFQFTKDGVALEDTDVIDFSLNDYISNVFGGYFPQPSFTYDETTADYVIQYIRDIHQGAVNYEDCSQRESTLSTNQKRAVLKLHLQNPVGEFITFDSELLGTLSLYDIHGKACPECCKMSHKHMLAFFRPACILCNSVLAQIHTPGNY